MNRYSTRTLILEIGMICAAIVFAFPLYIMLNLSLSPQNATSDPLVPTLQPTLSNFGQAWQSGSLAGAITNSIIVTVISVSILVFLAAMAAYPLARLTSRWSTVTFWIVMAGLLIPFQLAMIPLYQTMRDLGLIGTIWALVLFYSGQQIPLSVFLFLGFMRALPHEFEEAAWVDGANAFTAFWKILFPMLRPVTATVVVLNAIHIWNDFFTPLLYLSGSGNQTIPVALYAFVGEYNTNWPVVFAGLVLGILPILIAYFILQKRIIHGFAGGLKG
jgi:raffinose/stachyose/melibiose transport system permease protein